MAKLLNRPSQCEAALDSAKAGLYRQGPMRVSAHASGGEVQMLNGLMSLRHDTRC
jgi:hypothetical protein